MVVFPVNEVVTGTPGAKVPNVPKLLLAFADG